MPATRVLVVDDDASCRELVRLALDGYVVDQADSGDVALERALSALPDLVILDVSLPGRSGFEIFADLRAEPTLAAVPVVMLTASADEGTEWRARELGAAAFVAKPVDPEDLVRVVQKSLLRPTGK